MQLFGEKSRTENQFGKLGEVLLNVDWYSSYALLLTDDSKNILQVNEEFLKIFQYSIEEILGKDSSFINSGMHLPSFYNQIWETIKKGNVYSNYINTKRKDGVIIRSRIKVIPVKKDSGDYYYLCLYDPLGEENSFSLDVLDSYQVLIELTEEIPDIICIKDGEGRWLLANKADLKLFQLEGVNYQGKTDAELANDTHEIYQNAFLACMNTDELCWQYGGLKRTDEIIPVLGGDDKVLDVLKIPVFNKDGSRKNLIVIGRDVTDHRKSEEELKRALVKAKESDKLKSTFLATMSHELRTPLNSVIGFSSLMFDEDDVDEFKEYARIINNNGQMLLSLIEDLFDVSLIESDQMQIEKSEVDIIKAISEVYEMFPAEISKLNKLNLDFNMDIPYDEFIVTTDDFRVKQILTNLLRNALKFTDNGSITIQFETNDTFIFISVKDTGIGIIPEKLLYIFDAFRQGDTGLTRKFGGAGLGLAISKKLAILLGGDLRASSQVNIGSKFTLQIPRI